MGKLLLVFDVSWLLTAEAPGKEGKSHEVPATSLPAVGVDKSWGVANVGVESKEFSEPVKEIKI